MNLFIDQLRRTRWYYYIYIFV